MTDAGPTTTESAPPRDGAPQTITLDPKVLAIGVYALFLAGLLTAGATAVAGVIIAYVVRGDAPDWLKSHYTFQIRTFWLALAGAVAGGALVPVFGVGLLVLVAVFLWFLVRAVAGLSKLLNNLPYPSPNAYLI